ncbi:MAG: PEP-CTERM sorting domain-containing protein [Okeania sp. SIO3I5]|uniref:PEP-CTERM sorting domain-containing protein n=1 Tax=Okeania sp. SIO3I5 TaxID=2607805 RepID=UPI0013BB6D0A|nr:PEP-CTERM sorting domain-containing protein [Okeania sp. SIO3I5]NEQ34810.1 PEP-CTERM sorting domain-containing protein [Okeania sp. SIO3I5]
MIKTQLFGHLKKKCQQGLGILCGAASFCGLMQLPVTAASFQTTFTFLSDPDFSKMLLDWSGYDSSGNGLISSSEGELESWNISLFDKNNVLKWSDHVVQEGTVLDTADGLDRSSSGIQFEYELANSSFVEFQNDNSGLLGNFTDAFLEVYYESDPEPMIIIDNVDFDPATQVGDSRAIRWPRASTNPQVATPEPSLILGLIGIGGLILGSKRKTKG